MYGTTAASNVDASKVCLIHFVNCGVVHAVRGIHAILGTSPT